MKQEEIHDKGFRLPYTYNKINVGPKTLDSAVLDLGSIRKANRIFGDKNHVLRALAEKDIPVLRQMS